jgi:hypothetical protein
MEGDLAMADQSQPPETIDPYNVPEVICVGRVNVSVLGQLATLTFTHERPDAKALLEGRMDVKGIVRARIVTTVANLHALRDLLIAMTQSAETLAPATGGTTRH